MRKFGDPEIKIAALVRLFMLNDHKQFNNLTINRNSSLQPTTFSTQNCFLKKNSTLRLTAPFRKYE